MIILVKIEDNAGISIKTIKMTRLICDPYLLPLKGIIATSDHEIIKTIAKNKYNLFYLIYLPQFSSPLYIHKNLLLFILILLKYYHI